MWHMNLFLWSQIRFWFLIGNPRRTYVNVQIKALKQREETNRETMKNQSFTLRIPVLLSIVNSLYPFSSSSHAHVVLNSWHTCNKNQKQEIPSAVFASKCHRNRRLHSCNKDKKNMVNRLPLRGISPICLLTQTCRSSSAAWCEDQPRALGLREDWTEEVVTPSRIPRW